MAGFLTPALRELRWRVTSTNPQNPAYWLQRAFAGAPTATGKRIDTETAMSFSAFFNGCRILGEDIGTLPFPVYRRKGPKGRETGKEPARDDPAWALLNRAANPEMGAADFRKAIQGQAVAQGNGFAEIEWDSVMRPLAFWPLRSDRMRLVRNGVDVDMAGAPAGQLVYLYTLPSGQQKAFSPKNILHIRGFSGNGLWGYSIVGLAREGIAVELAAQEYLARFFANDATPGLAFKLPVGQALTDKALERLRESWDESHLGLSNAHRMAILENGMDVASVGMSHQDAEFMATRKFSVTEMSRWFRIPAHMLSDLDRSTNNNIEWQGTEYVKFSIRPWCIGWEQELALKGVVREPVFAEHNVDGLQRGDMQARGQFYTSMRNSSGITSVEIREKENLPTDDLPASAGELWYPLNMAPASAYDDNGMTQRDRVEMVDRLVRAGYDPADALAAFGLPTIAHTGLVPVSVQLDPSSLPAPQQGGSSA